MEADVAAEHFHNGFGDAQPSPLPPLARVSDESACSNLPKMRD
jgi:hypothetical protein